MAQIGTSQSPTKRIRAAALVAILLLALIILSGAVWYFLIILENEPAQASDLARLSTADSNTMLVVSNTPIPTQTAVHLPVDMVGPTLVPLNTATTMPASTTTPIPTTIPSPTPQLTATPAKSATPMPTFKAQPERLVIGQSVTDSPIEVVSFGNGPTNIIFIGGLHAGFAPGTVTLAQQAVTYFEQNPQDIPQSLTVYVVVSANPDSDIAPGELNGRLNANNVDLNRNWDCNWVSDARWRGDIVRGSGGTAPFSEPETQSLRDFILEKQPVTVIFWEARAENGLVSPGNCGARSQVSEEVATIYGAAAGYPVSDFEKLTNQVLNGDGADWLDRQGVPAIAVLLSQYTNSDWQQNLAGILAILKHHS